MSTKKGPLGPVWVHVYEAVRERCIYAKLRQVCGFDSGSRHSSELASNVEKSMFEAFFLPAFSWVHLGTNVGVMFSTLLL